MLLILVATLLASPTAKLYASSTPIYVQKLSQQKFKVSIQSFEKEFKKPLEELKTFSVSPSFENGLFSGLKVDGFSPKCKLSNFGIQENDTIESINGTPLRFPSDIIEIGKKLQKVRPGHKVRVSICRKNKTLTNTYLLIK